MCTSICVVFGSWLPLDLRMLTWCAIPLMFVGNATQVGLEGHRAQGARRVVVSPQHGGMYRTCAGSSAGLAAEGEDRAEQGKEYDRTR